MRKVERVKVEGKVEVCQEWREHGDAYERLVMGGEWGESKSGVKSEWRVGMGQEREEVGGWGGGDQGWDEGMDGSGLRGG